VCRSGEKGEPVRNLVEVTFMSLNGVMDAPKLVQEAVPYFQNDQEHSNFAEKLLFAADALLLGRKTYEAFAEAYPSMANSSNTGSNPKATKQSLQRLWKRVS
jgi:dihydrofolate reductase